MKTKSFTLIELLVVIVIIGILAGVIIVSTSSSIGKANIAKVKVFENSVLNELGANMVSRWKLDEIIGTTTTPDAWGNNTGTLGDGVTASTYPTLKEESECVTGKCMYFDGVNDYIMIENQIDDKNIYEKTISVWLNVSDFGTTAGNYISKQASGHEPYRIEINNTTIYFWYSIDSLTRYSVGTQMLISKNQWTNLLCVFNNGTVYFYKNGELMGHNVGDGSFIRSSVGTLFIGARRNDSIESFFNGFMDDVRIYNTALSSAQIKKQYVAGLDSLLSIGNISKEEYDQRINALALNND